MQIALLNQSHRVTAAAAVREIAVGLNRQLALHVAPLWHRLSVPVVPYFDPAKVPAASWPLVIVDSPDQAGALGYHTEDVANTPGGLPRIHGFVFVDPVLDNGGTILDGENSVAAVASHETCELYVDPNCQLLADDGNGSAYALEVADPCEQDSYRIQGLTRPVSVSNFVLPSWFDGFAAGDGQPVDFLKKLPGPFTMDAGGYVSVLQEGQVQQKFGELMPVWKQEAHQLAGSRFARRARQLARVVGTVPS